MAGAGPALGAERLTDWPYGHIRWQWRKHSTSQIGRIETSTPVSRTLIITNICTVCDAILFAISKIDKYKLNDYQEIYAVASVGFD
jgi:hypothetical protein